MTFVTYLFVAAYALFLFGVVARALQRRNGRNTSTVAATPEPVVMQRPAVVESKPVATPEPETGEVATRLVVDDETGGVFEWTVEKR